MYFQSLPAVHQRRFDRVERSQLAYHVCPYFYIGVLVCCYTPVVLQRKCPVCVLSRIYKKCNTSSITVPSMNNFLGYDLADFFDLGQ